MTYKFVLTGVEGIDPYEVERNEWAELERRSEQQYRQDHANDPIETINPVIDRSQPFGTEPEASPARPKPATAPAVPTFAWHVAITEAQRQVMATTGKRRCQCGATECESFTRRVFAPGHDAKFVSVLLDRIRQRLMTRANAVDAIVQVTGGNSRPLMAKFEKALIRSGMIGQWGINSHRDPLSWHEVTATLWETDQTLADGTPIGTTTYGPHGESHRYVWRVQYRALSGIDSRWTSVAAPFQSIREAIAWDAANGPRARISLNAH